MNRNWTITTIILLTFLIACGTPATQTTISEPVLPSTEVPVVSLPTPTLEPTLEPTIVPSATPEGQIFRDDFTGSLQPGWTWENESPDRWSITPDGWLQIIAEDTGIFAGGKQSNLLWRDLPSGNFAISVHLKTQPTSNFQQAAIFLFADVNNYVAINRGFCALCFPGKDGNGIFMDYKINGQGNAYRLYVTQTDVYLRLTLKDKVIYALYGFSPDAWQQLGRFGNYFQFKKVGLGASNLDHQNQNDDLVAQYDYFEITQP